MKDEVMKRKQIFRNAFGSPDGKRALEILQQDFLEAPMFHSDPLEMARRAAQADIVRYMTDMSKGEQ